MADLPDNKPLPDEAAVQPAKPAGKAPGRKSRRGHTRHGLYAVMTKVKLKGLSMIDQRTASARALMQERRDWIADLGGDDAISAKKRSFIDVAVRTKCYLDTLDAWLMGQEGLINKKRRAVIPVLLQRQTLADSLARYLVQLGLERKMSPIIDLRSYTKSADDAEHQPEPAAPQEDATEPQEGPA